MRALEKSCEREQAIREHERVTREHKRVTREHEQATRDHCHEMLAFWARAYVKFKSSGTVKWSIQVNISTVIIYCLWYEAIH